MSRTRHHRNQKHQHNGFDYGGKYNCNKNYAQGYGTDGRDLADSERRRESKQIIRDELEGMEDGSDV